MRLLQDLRVFVDTARLGSLSAVARKLDKTPAAISAVIKRLENDLGMPLFVRSTRRLRLTPAGETLLSNAIQALQLLDDSVESVRTGQTTIRGLLGLSLPSDFGRNYVLGWLDDFLALHPGLELRIQLSDSIADLYSQPVDVVLRYGSPPDSGLVALPVVSDNRRLLCAAPEYIARYGQPSSPVELAEHNCLCFMLDDATHARWHFFRDNEEQVVSVTGNRRANDGEAVRRWALAGQGIAYKSALDVRDDLQSGRLVQLCPGWQGEVSPLNLICADRRQLNPAIQALRAFLVVKCGGSSSGVSEVVTNHQHPIG